MKDIVIIGAGGMGREIKDIVKAINNVKPVWNILGFYDDAYISSYIVSDNFRCLGTIEDLQSQKSKNINVVFGIADREVVSSIVEQLQDKNNFNFPNIIHPSVEINTPLTMGIGNVLAFGTFLSCDISIGNYNFLNTSVSFGHDVQIANFNAFMPRTQISGNVIIGSLNFFGMNSAVVQNKSIGSNNIVNAFTLLTKSIKNDRKYFGIPGRRINI